MFAALFAVVGRDSIFSALVGMSLTFSLEVSKIFFVNKKKFSKIGLIFFC